MKTSGTLVALFLFVAAAALWFIYSGTYNIAATQPHTEFGRWLFTTVRDQSIEEHATGIMIPDLQEPRMSQAGARHYAATCAMCHGAPGQELSEIAKGLNPPPPELHTGEVQKVYTDAELYWIVEHGIRMTGMPAFGPTHKEQDLWSIVAFVKKLPELKAEQYQSMVKTGGQHHSAPRQHSD